MKFSGPGPEVINSRCAMVGFPTTVLYELNEHRQFLELLSALKNLFAVVCLVITVASLVPIAKEVKFGGLGKTSILRTLAKWSQVSLKQKLRCSWDVQQ